MNLVQHCKLELKCSGMRQMFPLHSALTVTNISERKPQMLVGSVKVCVEDHHEKSWSHDCEHCHWMVEHLAMMFGWDFPFINQCGM